MTKNRNNTNRQSKVLGVNPMSNKSGKQKQQLKNKSMVKKKPGNQDNKVVQLIKNVNESDGNKSDSMKKSISLIKGNVKQNNSPIKPENKMKDNKKNNNKKNNLKDENSKQNMKKNTQKNNSNGETKSSGFSKQKNVHKTKKEVDTVACPKDIQLQMSDRLFDRNDCTLFVRFGRDTGPQDRLTLRKTFTDKVKEIRDHKRYRNLNYVEFESREQLEEMKPQIEQMKTTGDKPFVDYMGDKGKIDFQKDEMKINPQKLFISGIPKGTATNQIKPLFQKCSKVTIPKGKYTGDKSYGFVFFDNESDAKEAFESSQNIKIGDSNLLVVFSKVRTNEIVSDNKRQLPQENDKENKVDESPSKKQKMNKDEADHEQEEKDKVEVIESKTEESVEMEEGHDKDSEESESDDDEDEDENEKEDVKDDDDDEDDDDDDDDDEEDEDDEDDDDDDDEDDDDDDE